MIPRNHHNIIWKSSNDELVRSLGQRDDFIFQLFRLLEVFHLKWSFFQNAAFSTDLWAGQLRRSGPLIPNAGIGIIESIRIDTTSKKRSRWIELVNALKVKLQWGFLRTFKHPEFFGNSWNLSYIFFFIFQPIFSHLIANKCLFRSILVKVTNFPTEFSRHAWPYPCARPKVCSGTSASAEFCSRGSSYFSDFEKSYNWF